MNKETTIGKFFTCIQGIRMLMDKSVAFSKGETYVGVREKPSAKNFFNEVRLPDEINWRFVNDKGEKHLIPEEFLKDYFEEKYNFYEEQLNGLDLSDKNFSIKITSNLRNNQTKWMDINNESIKAVIEFLSTKMLKY